MSKPVLANLDFGGVAKATGLPTPSSSSDAVPKSYADGLVSDPQLNAVGPGFLFPYNWSNRFRKTLADVRTGASRGRILVAGDSTSAITTLMSETNSWPKRLAGYLGGENIPASNIFTWHGYTTIDTRVSLGADWGGGGDIPWYYDLSGTSQLTFSPSEPVTHFEVFYWSTDTTEFDLQVDSGSVVNVPTNPADTGWPYAMRSVTVSAALGVHTLKVIPTVGSSAWIVAINAYDAGAPAFDIFNVSQGGADISIYNEGGDAWKRSFLMAAIDPDLSIINLGINGWDNPPGSSSIPADMTTFVTTLNGYGDVILFVPHPTSGGSADAIHQAHRDGFLGIAKTAGVGFVDGHRRWADDYDEANALGFMADGLHQNALGSDDKAFWMAGLIKRFA